MPLPLFENHPKRQPINKELLREYLTDDEADEVFEDLLAKAEDEILKNEIRLLEKRWTKNIRQLGKGTITNEVFRAEDLSINEILLTWISKW